jgi:hypothetical protein
MAFQNEKKIVLHLFCLAYCGYIYTVFCNLLTNHVVQIYGQCSGSDDLPDLDLSLIVRIVRILFIKQRRKNFSNFVVVIKFIVEYDVNGTLCY